MSRANCAGLPGATGYCIEPYLDTERTTLTDGFVLHELGSDVRVSVGRGMPALPNALEAEVEALWQSACARVAAGGAGTLFNGRVLSADTMTPRRITGHLTEFRRIVAQMERPGLFGELGLRPLAVCGVLCCADGVPVGRRHPAAIYQPGLWQLPPAGSVDPDALDADGNVSLHTQVLAELTEELGVAAAHVHAVQPLCMVEHPGSHILDVGMRLTTSLTGAQVLEAHRTSGNTEYDPIIIVPYVGLVDFVTRAGDSLVPPARAFLARTGLLPSTHAVMN